MCFALMNTSPQISEDRVPTISGSAEGQRRSEEDRGDGGVHGKYSMQYLN